MAQSPPAQFKRSIVGEWIRESNAPVFLFQPDGTVRITQASGSMTAKYRADTNKLPHHLEFFDFAPAGAAPEGGKTYGIFAIEGGKRLQFEMAKERPKEFSANADIAIRRGNQSSAEGSIVGEWVKEIPIKEGYIFTADGTVRTVYRYRNEEPRLKEYKYRVDDSSSPHRLNFYFRDVNDEPAFRGIVAFENDSRLKLDGRWTQKEAERPKQFGPDTEVLVRFHE